MLKRLLCAVAFALEGDPHDYNTDLGILTFDMNVAPGSVASQPSPRLPATIAG